ncbi:hypothetical protein LZ31DRAFT_36448 [Colletotrichum somersetense]|nr:hypothetical protein LZ31DRAFT_36448 [Colletotrichum somersetense]
MPIQQCCGRESNGSGNKSTIRTLENTLFLSAAIQHLISSGSGCERSHWHVAGISSMPPSHLVFQHTLSLGLGSRPPASLSHGTILRRDFSPSSSVGPLTLKDERPSPHA